MIVANTGTVCHLLKENHLFLPRGMSFISCSGCTLTMKRCGHSKWLALRIQRNELVLLESDRLQTLVDHIPNPDAHQLSLVVLVGGAAKSSALQWLASGGKCRKPTGRRGSGSDIDLQLGGSSAFGDKVILLADGDLPYQVPKYRSSSVGECHETTRRILPRIREGVGCLALDEAADNLYSRLLCPFADVFCFFSADFGGFRPIVRYLASWLEKGRPSTLSKATYPRVLVVAEATTPCDESEKEAKDVFLGEFKKETTKEFAKDFRPLTSWSCLPHSCIEFWDIAVRRGTDSDCHSTRRTRPRFLVGQSSYRTRSTNPITTAARLR